MIRCPECGERFALEDPDDDADVAYCPFCDSPVDLAYDNDRPGATPAQVILLQATLTVPSPLGLSAAIYVQSWELGGCFAAYSLISAFPVWGLYRGSSAARVVVFVWGVMVAALATVACVVGVPLILAWGLGILLIAAALPLLIWGLVIAILASTPTCREWCDR